MNHGFGRIAAIILLAGLLAVPMVMNRLASPGATARAPSAVPASEASSRYGFHLEEVSRSSGIDFTHQAPTLDAKLDHIMPQIASMGAGVSAVDFDRDGRQDLYVTNSGEGSLNRLYHNSGGGQFRDVAQSLGVADVNREGTGVSMGSVWGDYDNDGYEDLFLYKWGKPELFHSEGGKVFRRVTESAGLPPWINAGCATWVDYDRDGLIDLYIGGYWDERLDLWHLTTTKMMPESFEYARNGGRNYLLRNRGDGTFEDVTATVGADSRRWALCVGAADLLGSGYPDLFIANDYGVSELFANRGGRKFEEIGKQTGVGFAPKSGMNVAFGDIFNQGRFSIYVTNISEEGVLIQGNNLWVPKEGTAGESLEYQNLARELGVELGGWSFGAQFGDLNNDGTQDLVLANGYVSADRKSSYWYDFAMVAGGHSSIISDAKNWPPMQNKSLSGYQPKRLWLNDGAGRFAEVAQAVGFDDTHDGRAIVLADLQNRGALDVVMACQRGPLLVYSNNVTPENAWIAFDLVGTKSNRSAIGAQLRLFCNGQEQLQEVSGGGGYSAQSPRRLHFGLGQAPRIEKAVIRWPSGREQVIESPEPGRVHTVEEPQ
jgi:hypothetical protein